MDSSVYDLPSFSKVCDSPHKPIITHPSRSGSGLGLGLGLGFKVKVKYISTIFC